jgi:hypothetical protein
MRTCNTCQHLKRPDIDRRLAAGEPVAKIARAYELSVSSVQRHRANCLGLASSNEIMKAAARGSAAIALLPEKEDFGGSFAKLKTQIEEITTQAQKEGSLDLALRGLNSVRQTLESWARLAGHLQPATTQVNVAVQNNVNVGAAQIAERLIREFDPEPETKARIARVLMEDGYETAAN